MFRPCALIVALLWLIRLIHAEDTAVESVVPPTVFVDISAGVSEVVASTVDGTTVGVMEGDHVHVSTEGGVDDTLDSLLLERRVTTSSWQHIIFSSITVNNYESWLHSCVNLPVPAYLSYMKARNVHTTLYLQHYTPPIETGAGNTAKPNPTSVGAVDVNTFYELSFVSDGGEQFRKFQTHAQLEGNYLHSADLKGEIALSSTVDFLYNMSFFAGWSLAHLMDSASGAATYTYRPGDVLSVSKHRSTSFLKYCQYISEHVVEKWARRGLVHLMAGTMSDKLGSSVLLVAVFVESTEKSGAAEFSAWYKDLVNNQLSRLYKANSRSFALAPCVSHAYQVTASTDGVVVSNKQSRECTYRGENCVETLWTKSLPH